MFLPWLTEKSDLLKISDLKACRFRGVSVSSFLPICSRLSKKKERKAPKDTALRQVRITRVTLSEQLCDFKYGNLGFGIRQSIVHHHINGDIKRDALNFHKLVFVGLRFAER